ncbi:ABC transporter substrate-binding protein [Arthrobacter nitrophenolicus]|uniref:Multiple sugar transport system substrate-binding protein n=2 Tax=Arthrobacter nitrophenolicus TaxID=683150 RepID=A0ACC6TK49_9MICC|nr:ABC transporter substrate-binding protein [Arthrobacter nitrophenolicus]ELT44779.1 extracellular solute-binding protein family 1 protein [Arthrobacter nitrophenolicus]
MTYPPTRRSILQLSVAAAASALVLPGCGTGSNPADDESGPVTLRFSWWGGDARQKATQKVIDAFSAENPDITVVGEYGDWNGYWDKLATQVAANDAPDIIQMDEKYVREYGDRGALLDLKKLSLDTSGIDRDTLKSGEVDGELVGLVTGVATFCIAANPAVLEKAGVAMPDDTTWSWEDYKEIGRKISASGTGATGVGVGYGDQDLYIWARQHGDRLYDDDGNVVIKPETLVSFWENIKELSESGAAPKPSAIIENAAASLNQTALAKNEMGLAGIFSTQLTAFSSASGQQLKLLRLPGESQAKEQGAYYKASMFWAVSSRTRHQKAAEKFLNYLTNSQAAGDVMLTERGIPANTKVREAITPKLGATDKAAIDFTDAIADEVRPAPPITPAGGSTILEILSRYTSDILFDRTTPKKAAQPFIDELNSSLRK